MKTFFYK